VTFVSLAVRYTGLAVGLDNISPWDSAPIWMQYAALCGRNMERVSVPTTIPIYCTDVGTANRYRYVILQSGRPTTGALCFLEVGVMANGKQDI